MVKNHRLSLQWVGFMKMLNIVGNLALLVATVPAHAVGVLTPVEIEGVWADAKTQVETYYEKGLSYPREFYEPKIVYHNGQWGHPRYVGFIVSNERPSFFTRRPNISGELHVGFGTAINFNIVGAHPGVVTREEKNGKIVSSEAVRHVLFVDQSYEVVVAMMSFWRPIWLVSKTPVEWLANVAGYPLDPRETLDSIFNRIRRRELGTVKAVEVLQKKFVQLLQEKKITQFDFKFAMAVVGEQIHEYRPQLFRYSSGANRIAHSLELIYNLVNRYEDIQSGPWSWEEKEKQKANAAQIYQITSFLHNAGNYQRMRKVYEAGQDYYAQAEIEDESFWKAVQEFSSSIGQKVTDVYISNIPISLRAQRCIRPEDKHDSNRKLRSLFNIGVGSGKYTLFETQGMDELCTGIGMECIEVPCQSSTAAK